MSTGNIAQVRESVALAGGLRHIPGALLLLFDLEKIGRLRFSLCNISYMLIMFFSYGYTFSWPCCYDTKDIFGQYAHQGVLICAKHRTG